MKKSGNIRIGYLSLALFFAISVYANISKADEHIYSKIDYIHCSNPSGIELVIALQHTDSNFWNSSSNGAIYFSTSTAVLPHINRLMLLSFERSIIQKLKALEINNSSQKNLIIILQKKNTWHQPDKADPSLI